LRIGPADEAGAEQSAGAHDQDAVVHHAAAEACQE
jgi:hypothetical protein